MNRISCSAYSHFCNYCQVSGKSVNCFLIYIALTICRHCVKVLLEKSYSQNNVTLLSYHEGTAGAFWLRSTLCQQLTLSPFSLADFLHA